jgi:hypothetical protein
MTQKNRQVQLFQAPTTFKGGQKVSGAIQHRPVDGAPLLKKVPVPTTSTTATDMTEAFLLGGIHVKTPTAAQDFQVPDGTEISAAIGADLEVGDSFDFTLINLGGAGDIVTLIVDTGVTFVGAVEVDDAGADITSSGTFRFRNTGANTWVGYRVA